MIKVVNTVVYLVTFSSLAINFSTQFELDHNHMAGLKSFEYFLFVLNILSHPRNIILS